MTNVQYNWQQSIPETVQQKPEAVFGSILVEANRQYINKIVDDKCQVVKNVNRN